MLRRRVIEGYVVSDKMQKTVVLEASTLVKHPKYGKYYKKFKKYKVHDESETAGVGDKIQAVESRKISSQKRFRLLKVVEKARGEVVEAKEEV